MGSTGDLMKKQRRCKCCSCHASQCICIRQHCCNAFPKALQGWKHVQGTITGYIEPRFYAGSTRLSWNELLPGLLNQAPSAALCDTINDTPTSLPGVKNVEMRGMC